MPSRKAPVSVYEHEVNSGVYGVTFHVDQLLLFVVTVGIELRHYSNIPSVIYYIASGLMFVMPLFKSEGTFLLCCCVVCDIIGAVSIHTMKYDWCYFHTHHDMKYDWWPRYFHTRQDMRYNWCCFHTRHIICGIIGAVSIHSLICGIIGAVSIHTIICAWLKLFP